MDSLHRKKTNKYFFALLAMMIVPISGLSIDIYVPSLPAVSQYFNVDKNLAQLTVTSYMLGLGLMQLFAGGISDSYGRRKPFLIAILIYIASTLCISLSSSIYELLLLRFTQGIVVGLTVVPMRSVIPDLFEGRELNKMLNYMTMAWSIGPIIAPAIGGYLQHFFSWKANFYFLAIYSSLVFSLVLFFLPETSNHRHPFHMSSMLKRYKDITTNMDYLSGVVMDGLLYTIVVLFAVVGPFLIQKMLHYSPIQFGHAALLVGLAWFLGSMTNRFIIHVELERKANLCLWIMAIVAMIMLLQAILLPLSIYTIVPAIFFLAWLGGIIFPNYFFRTVMLFPKSTGSANALFGAFTFLITGLASGLGSFLRSTSQLPLAITYIILVIMCLMIFYKRVQKGYT